MGLCVFIFLAVALVICSCAQDKESWETSELCQHPPSETGSCQGSIKRWTFRKPRCRSFTYGGCDATKNFFYTKEECLFMCVRRRKKETKKQNRTKKQDKTKKQQEP